MTSSTRRLPLPDLFAHSRRKTGRGDTEWESVMVQITLAFVIILGYLVSKGITDSRELTQQIAQQKRSNSRLQQIVTTFANSELGREQKQRIAAQQEVRYFKLLNRWLRVKEERKFYKLIQIYRNAELVQLSHSLESLPVESSFQELNTEIARIFPLEVGKVSPLELKSLLNQVVEEEGFSIRKVEELEELMKISPDAAEFYDDPKAFRMSDIKMLAVQITTDLNEERTELVEIQLALIDKIFAARLEKLATMPLENEQPIESDVSGPDLGRRILEKILTDLRTEVQLLPEAEERLRANGSNNGDNAQ